MSVCCPGVFQSILILKPGTCTVPASHDGSFAAFYIIKT